MGAGDAITPREVPLVWVIKPGAFTAVIHRGEREDIQTGAVHSPRQSAHGHLGESDEEATTAAEQWKEAEKEEEKETCLTFFPLELVSSPRLCF